MADSQKTDNRLLCTASRNILATDINFTLIFILLFYK